MSKLKRIFNLSILAIASVGIIAGTTIAINKNNQNNNLVETVALSNGEIQNETPDFFSAKLFHVTTESQVLKQDLKSNPYCLVESGDQIQINFSTEEQTINSLTHYVYNYTPEDDQTWTAFTFGNLSLKKDDENITFSYITPSHITTSTNIFYETSKTQSFNLNIKLGSEDQSEDQLNGDTLTLKDEGIYTICIPYTKYETTDGGNSFEIVKNQNFSFTFFLSNKTNYSTDNINNITFDKFTQDSNNYFYNYQEYGAPNISYNPERFSITIETNTEIYQSNTTYDFNNKDKNISITGDDIFKNIYDSEGANNKIILQDIGKYKVLPKAVYYVGETKYEINYPIETKMLYLFGYQASYTKYNNELKQNEYPEFKTYDNNYSISESADISRFISKTDLDKNTITLNQEIDKSNFATTNQTPVKFNENANLAQANLYKYSGNSSLTSLTGEVTLSSSDWTKTQINASKNISEEGIYIAIFQYTFDNYTKNGETHNKVFNQVFLFKIDKSQPTLSVKTGTDSDYHDIYSGQYTNENVYINCKSLEGSFIREPIVTVTRTDWNDKIEPTCTLGINEINIFEKSGEYSICIYNGRMGLNETPSTRTFIIDKEEISNYEVWGVEQIDSNTYYKTNQLNENKSTNQSFALSWDTHKPSGAKITATAQFYPLTYVSGNLYYKIADEVIASDYTLDLSTKQEQLCYNSLDDKQIGGEYIKNSAGLYIITFRDEANNEKDHFILYDTSTPKILKYDGSGYSEIKSSETINSGHKIYWGKYKLIKIIKGSTTDLAQFKKNYDTYSPNKESELLYLKIELNDSIYLKTIDDSNYKKEDPITSYYIPSSYTRYYDYDNKFYYYTYYYYTYYNIFKISESKFKETIASLTTALSEYQSLVNLVNNVEENETEFGIIDALPDNVKKNYEYKYIEGQFSFLIRDKSNTKGSSLSEENQFINYPSNYKTIKMTSDESQFELCYNNNNNEKTELDLASYATQYKTNTNTNTNTCTMYYNPTNLNKEIYISLFTNNVGSVSISYYPFVNQQSSNLNGTKITTSYYRTLSNIKETSLLDEKTLTSSTLSEPNGKKDFYLPIQNGMTKEGKYIITRIYKDGASINTYDFKTRTLEIIVDRENVISAPEVINAKVKKYKFADGTENYIYLIDTTLISTKKLEKEKDYGIAISTVTTDGTLSYYTITETERDALLNGTNEKFTNQFTYLKEIQSETSAQSIVGSGLFISVYSETDKSVEYPKYKEVGIDDFSVAINSGYTLYSNNDNISKYYANGSIIKSPTSKIITNKLPVKIYIPEYKYTTIQTKQTKDNKNKFNISKNDNLSLFYKDQYIQYYQLNAEVWRSKPDNTTFEKIAYSSNSSDNGFLNFVDAKNNTISNFTDEGVYVILVSQGANSTPGEQTFKKSYIYSFTISNKAIDFKVSSNDISLEGVDNDLYTNKSEIKIEWTDDQSEYIANYDKTKIYLKTNQMQTDQKLEINNNDVTLDSKTIGSYTFNENVKTHIIKINLEKLNCYNHGDFIKITMQIDCPNTQYYENNNYQTTKTIHIDKSIFDNNGKTSLDSILSSQDRNVKDTRDFKDINNRQTENKNQTSFAQTKNNGNNKYYSYIIDKDDLANLKEISKKKDTKTSDMVYCYYKEYDDIYTTDFEEIDHSSFNTLNFNLLREATEFNNKKYYQIVEKDYAGNLNIYLVRYIDEIPKEDYAIKFGGKSISYEELQTDKFNIYGDLDLQITDLSTLDSWLTITIEKNNNQATYYSSPWDPEHVININTKEKVLISSLLDNLSKTNKTKIYLSNRINGSNNLIYVSKSDSTKLILSKPLNNDEEGVVISLSTNDIYNDMTIQSYPVGIAVYKYDKLESRWSPSPEPEISNDPNDKENLINNDYKYINNWGNNDFFNVEYSNNYLKIIFKIKLDNNTKIKYVVTDNFGNEYSEIHIVGTNFIDQFENTGNIYKILDEKNNIHYYTQNDISYIYNKNIYRIEIDPIEGTKSGTNGSFNYIKFFCGTDPQFNKEYQIKVYDSESKSESEDDPPQILKTYYIHLYNTLPVLRENIDDLINELCLINEHGNLIEANEFTNSQKKVTINGIDYLNYQYSSFYADIINIQIRSKKSEDVIPFNMYLYKENGSESDFVPISSNYKIKESGIYYLLFKYNSTELFTNEYILYKFEILNISSNFFTVTKDGEIIKASNYYYTDNNGKQYSNYYMVNSPTIDNIKIIPNEYQKVRVFLEDQPIQNDNIITYIYTLSNAIVNESPKLYAEGTSPYEDYVVISLIPKTDSPATFVSYVSESGAEESILNDSQYYIVPQTELQNDILKIKWAKFNGIESNRITPTIIKDDHEYYTEIFEDSNSFYVLLTISGSYQFKFSDESGNIQKFKDKDYVEIIFLPDVHFTIIHQEELTQDGEIIIKDIETEAFSRGVFNGSVKLVLKDLNKFYSVSSVGTGNNILQVKRNGIDYTSYSYDSSLKTYTFNEVGYYEFTFSAISSTGIPIKQKLYSFTIINSKESRFAYSFSSFNNYEIESLTKDDGLNISQLEISNNKNLFISYTDANTGFGFYTITINTNKKLSLDGKETVKFTYSFLIRSKIPPIEVSLEEGGSTTKVITVTFNPINVYNTVGACILSCDGQNIAINENTISQLGQAYSVNITTAGTHYIQVRTESGSLLYSYMVNKKTPLNSWAIVAICLGSVGLVAGIIIAIRLRKKIKIK